ncbi:hypothetical protein HK102_006013 [Quaeritorhiza haematococci]|nr:hypothetical protein HK102_006013 [Quaeritorhiza haematococci]
MEQREAWQREQRARREKEEQMQREREQREWEQRERERQEKERQEKERERIRQEQEMREREEREMRERELQQQQARMAAASAGPSPGSSPTNAASQTAGTPPAPGSSPQQQQNATAPSSNAAAAASTTAAVVMKGTPGVIRTRKKVRHVQIQTRGAMMRDANIQTDTPSTPPTTNMGDDDSNDEQEAARVRQTQELLIRNQTLESEVSRLAEALEASERERERMTYTVEENKAKFDRLSAQAYKKLKELLTERKIMEIEISSLRAQLEALELQNRTWLEGSDDEGEDVDGVEDGRGGRRREDVDMNGGGPPVGMIPNGVVA